MSPFSRRAYDRGSRAGPNGGTVRGSPTVVQRWKSPLELEWDDIERNSVARKIKVVGYDAERNHAEEELVIPPRFPKPNEVERWTRRSQL